MERVCQQTGMRAAEFAAIYQGRIHLHLIACNAFDTGMAECIDAEASQTATWYLLMHQAKHTLIGFQAECD